MMNDSLGIGLALTLGAAGVFALNSAAIGSAPAAVVSTALACPPKVIANTCEGGNATLVEPPAPRAPRSTKAPKVPKAPKAPKAAKSKNDNTLVYSLGSDGSLAVAPNSVHASVGIASASIDPVAVYSFATGGQTAAAPSQAASTSGFEPSDGAAKFKRPRAARGAAGVGTSTASGEAVAPGVDSSVAGVAPLAFAIGGDGEQLEPIEIDLSDLEGLGDEIRAEIEAAMASAHEDMAEAFQNLELAELDDEAMAEAFEGFDESFADAFAEIDDAMAEVDDSVAEALEEAQDAVDEAMEAAAEAREEAEEACDAAAEECEADAEDCGDCEEECEENCCREDAVVGMPIEVPDFELAEIEIPEIEIPEISIPPIVIPEIKTPHVVVPEIRIDGKNVKLPRITVNGKEIDLDAKVGNRLRARLGQLETELPARLEKLETELPKRLARLRELKVPSNARMVRLPGRVVARERTEDETTDFAPGMAPSSSTDAAPSSPPAERTKRTRERAVGGEDLNREMLELLNDLRNEVKELRKDVDQLKQDINATVVTTPLVLSSMTSDGR